MKRTVKYLFILVLGIGLFSCGNNVKDTHANKTIPDSLPPEEKRPLTEGYNPEEHIDFGGLARYFKNAAIDSLVKQKPQPELVEGEINEYVHDYLTEKEMWALNVRDLLYYCLQYPGDVSQICSDSWEADSTMTPKLVAHFYFDISGEVMSNNQENALFNRADSVELLVKDYMLDTKGKIDEQALVILWKTDRIKNIPFVIETISDERLVNYTYLALVMKENNYAPFKKTKIYEKLYGDESWQYSRVEASKENRDLLVKLARNMYREKSMHLNH